MKGLELARKGERLKVLCLGAHADDIEIGAGGTLLAWIAKGVKLEATWCVLSAVGEREAEARAGAADVLEGAASADVRLGAFRDGYFPAERDAVKDWIEELKAVAPDVVLTHARDDAHQDHRLVCELAWNTFRDQLILEYEIPKYDGDPGSPNVFVHLEEDTARRKAALLLDWFPSQRSKRWFTEDLFLALMRLRGMEAGSPTSYAEAFYGRKVVLGRL
jgi:LmbE family N-acetylglucosaminyl deacetylase